MALKTVKYKLKFDAKTNGYITPDGIIDGGIIFDMSSPNVSDIVFIGKYDIKRGMSLPNEILEVVQDKILKLHNANKQAEELKQYKQSRYQSECDPLFIEAIRDKLVKNDETKWNEYISKIDSIHSLTSIPKKKGE